MPANAISALRKYWKPALATGAGGTSIVIWFEEIILLGENQSTYIPLGTTHRLENPGKIDLHMIEVQSGTYLGEDDIVRIEDIYQRG